MKKNILIIDDDQELCALMKKCMEKEGYKAEVAHTGSTGLLKIAKNDSSYTLIILDVLLPNLSGFEVLTQIRKDSTVPVLMLTAKGDEEDKIKGLKTGADDYLTKPFSLNELMARAESLIRRYTTFNLSEQSDVLLLNNMSIDRQHRIVLVDNQTIHLTSKEFDLLNFLASNKGKVFTKKQIYRQVWAEEYAFDDSNIMAFISKLRKKVEPDPHTPFYILTVHGVGYRFNKEA